MELVFDFELVGSLQGRFGQIRQRRLEYGAQGPSGEEPASQAVMREDRGYGSSCREAEPETALIHIPLTAGTAPVPIQDHAASPASGNSACGQVFQDLHKQRCDLVYSRQFCPVFRLRIGSSAFRCPHTHQWQRQCCLVFVSARKPCQCGTVPN